MEAITPMHIRNKEDFKNILAFTKFFSWNDLDKKRRAPSGIPIVATIVKMVAREITVEEVPITSEEVILVKTSHKRTPERNPTIVSTKIYAAPLPITFPLMVVTLAVIFRPVYKCAIIKIAKILEHGTAVFFTSS